MCALRANYRGTQEKMGDEEINMWAFTVPTIHSRAYLLRAALAGDRELEDSDRFHSTEVGTEPSDVVDRSPLV